MDQFVVGFVGPGNSSVKEGYVRGSWDLDICHILDQVEHRFPEGPNSGTFPPDVGHRAYDITSSEAVRVHRGIHVVKFSRCMVPSGHNFEVSLN